MPDSARWKEQHSCHSVNRHVVKTVKREDMYRSDLSKLAHLSTASNYNCTSDVSGFTR